MAALPQRRKLPHDVPSWVKDGSVYFITLCGLPRGTNQFCHPHTAEALINSVVLYHEKGTWFIRLFLMMPDHLHMLVSFPPTRSMMQVLSSWKGYHAKKNGIRWQRDFFEHRLRSNESDVEKASYIRNNPVRAGLISKAEDWPYVWQPW